MHTDFWIGKPNEKGDLEDLKVDGKIILSWILRI